MNETCWTQNSKLTWICRLIASTVFLYAGIAKVGDPAGFSTQVARYELMPAMANLIGLTFPWIEIVLGLCLLFGIWPRAAALGMLGLVILFIVAMVWALAKGLKIDCGCFGGNDPLTIWSLLRDSAILIPVAIAAYSKSHFCTLAPDAI